MIIKKSKNGYNEFIQYSVNAYLALRKRHRLILISQIPQLIVKSHINYLKEQLHLFDVDDKKI